MSRASTDQVEAAAVPSARSLLLVFSVALVVRVAVVLQLRGSVFFAFLLGDGRQYDAWAQQIAAGQWIGTDVFYQTPLYPYLLGVLYKIAGHHLLLVRLLQAVFGAASCALVAFAGARFFNRRAGLAAGWLLAFYGPAVFFDAVVQKSSLDGLLFAALLAVLALLLRARDLRALVAAGVLLGLFMINRENARVLYPAIALWLIAGPWTEPQGQRWRWVGVFSLAVGLVLLPVGLRNYHVGGQFLVSTSQLGPNFYMGNHAGAPGVYESLVEGRGDVEFERVDAEQLANAATGRKLTPSEVSDYWLGRGLAFAREQPGAWLQLLGRKLAMTLASTEIADTESIEAYADGASVLWLLRWLDFGVLLPLAAFGVWITRADWRRLSVLYLAFGAMTVAVAAFYVMARYRYPLVPVAALFAGASIAAWPRLRSDSAGSSQWMTGAALAILVAVLGHAFFRDTHDATYSNIGAEFTRAGRSAEAIPLLQRAVTDAPTYAQGHFNLGVALNETGDKAGALAQFQTAVNLKPDYLEALSSLALALVEAGRVPEAMTHFAAAARLPGTSPEAHVNFGQALASTGDWPKAINEFQAALALRPDYAKAHTGLAATLLATGKPGEALEHFERAATLAPKSLEAQYGLGQVYVQQGRIRDAIATFEKAQALAQASGRSELAAQIQDILRRLR